jgi:hypothetical protein
MATYVTPGDCTDPAVSIAESHCILADTKVNAALWSKGIDPASLTLPHPLLTALGVAYATALACLEKSKGEETTLLNKHVAYENQAKTLSMGITRQSLGLDVTTGASGGMGSIEIGRG